LGPASISRRPKRIGSTLSPKAAGFVASIIHASQVRSRRIATRSGAAVASARAKRAAQRRASIAASGHGLGKIHRLLRRSPLKDVRGQRIGRGAGGEAGRAEIHPSRDR
jgi:hypothetical protein